MSDSVKKYYEMVEEGSMSTDYNSLDAREQKILNLFSAAAKAGKSEAVHLRARQVMKEFGSTSLLLGLDIACQELL